MRVIVLILCLVLSRGSFAKDRDTPEVLRGRFQTAQTTYEQFVEDFNNLREQKAPSVLDEKEWLEITLRMNYVGNSLNTMAHGVLLCNFLSQGDFCDEAGDTIRIAERELEYLRKIRNKKYNAKEA